jgi:prephenate dehydrogenase
MKRVAIVGVGLIGGSLALALKEHGLVETITAVDWLGDAGRRVLADGVVDRFLDPEARSDVDAALAGADLVVLAAPVRVIRAEVTRALRGGAIVTDCGSTKRDIVAAAEESPARARFVPGHPMAGLPDGGVDNSRPDLFQGRRWIFCPEGSAPDAVAQVRTLVERIGAHPVTMSAHAHDRAVAFASHLPQLLASALRARACDFEADRAAGPGFASATRVGGGSPAIWEDIFASNADEISAALRSVIGDLEELAAAFEAAPPNISAVLELLDRARQARNAAQQDSHGKPV